MLAGSAWGGSGESQGRAARDMQRGPDNPEGENISR